MNDNIDLTKILKDCPKGWKLWSPFVGEVEFGHIFEKKILVNISMDEDVAKWAFNADATTSIGDIKSPEIMLYPSKWQRDWSKFTAPWYKKEIEHKFHVGQYITDGYIGGQITSIEDNYNCYKILDFNRGTNTTIPFALQDNYHLWTIQDAKEGDVLALSLLEDKNLWEKIIIFKKYHSEGVKGLCGMPCVEGYGNTIKNRTMELTEEIPYYSKTWTCNLHPATKEQRDLLFKKIKQAGYKWIAETKTLEKLVEVPDKFDPKTLQPFDKILVRDSDEYQWKCTFYSHQREKSDLCKYVTMGASYEYCIPYNDDTKHLVGTTEEAPEFYRYWEE